MGTCCVASSAPVAPAHCVSLNRLPSSSVRLITSWAAALSSLREDMAFCSGPLHPGHSCLMQMHCNSSMQMQDAEWAPNSLAKLRCLLPPCPKPCLHKTRREAPHRAGHADPNNFRPAAALSQLRGKVGQGRAPPTQPALQPWAASLGRRPPSIGNPGELGGQHRSNSSEQPLPLALPAPGASLCIVGELHPLFERQRHCLLLRRGWQQRRRRRRSRRSSCRLLCAV